jgi:hypothetical protein
MTHHTAPRRNHPSYPSDDTDTLPRGPDGRSEKEQAVADEHDVRRLALGLDGVEEIESDGFDFRVGGRGFVWSYPDRSGGRRVLRTDIAVLYVGDEAERQALLLGEPDLFFSTPAYEWAPLVMVRLEQVDVARLSELVTDAWRMRTED